MTRSVNTNGEEEESKGRKGKGTVSQINKEVPLQQGPSELAGQATVEELHSCDEGPNDTELEKKVSVITGEKAIGG